MKLNHQGEIRSIYADLHLTKLEAERLWERLESRREAFASNALNSWDQGHHRSGNYMDGTTVGTTTLRGCKHGDKGYTLKVRGCPAYRSMMMAGIRSEASMMDLLPEAI